MIAHEIPATFVYIASQGNTKNLRHFLLISVVYLLNVIITALHELEVIHWNFIYINLFLLISMSVVMGIWGFRQREVLYENIFSFEPLGAYFYVGLASICFITIAQLQGTSNDPAIKIIRDIIIFSHAAYGVIFILYVISNFILMLAQNMPVHKVLYKPTRMPYFTFRLAGLIATLGFVFYSGWHQYVYNSIAGFYNNIGDLYELLDKSAIAEAYYDQGAKYGFANNHANYAIGKLKTHRYNFDEAIENYEAANRRKPNVFSLTNEANLYYWKGDVRGATKAYRKAIEKISTGETYNNLAFAYAKLRNIDSVALYLDRAMKDKNAKTSAQANFIATVGLEYLPVNCDSLIDYFDNPYTATLANAVAVSTVQNHDFKTKVDVLKNEKLDLQSATLLNNYIIRNAKTLDTVFAARAFQIASDSLNTDYREAIKVALGFVYYHQGNVSKALEVLAEQVYLSQSYQGKYNYIMGLWALEQNNPKLAASYFKYAVDSDYKEGKLYYAIALTEGRQLQPALAAWDSVAAGGEETESQMAAKIKNVLNSTPAQVFSLADGEKYQFCRYKTKMNDSVFFNKIINSFNDDNYKAQALLDAAQRFSEAGDLKSAVQNFQRIRGLKLTDKKLYENIQHFELLLLAERRELRDLAKQINKGVSFDGRPLEKIYFSALLNEAANDTINATRNFDIVGKYNPYFEQAVIAAAEYFKTHGHNKMKPYNLLVEAVQINNNSIKLLKAYAAEASRMGFPEYAAGALEQVHALEPSIK
jgi:predicted negative regulator of RcsB-dependent stress response